MRYRVTVFSCFMGYVVQAIVNNFAPLLFVFFHLSYHIPLEQITLLVTINFCVQLLVDLLASKVADRMGQRLCALLATGLATLGLVLLIVLPLVMPPFAGLVVAVLFYGAGGGLLEVIISPIVDCCFKNTQGKMMSLLHSFYCWGHVAVVLISTGFFALFGIENWRYLAAAFAVVPLVNFIFFLKVPIPQEEQEQGERMPLKKLFTQPMFLLFLALMVCTGASEQAVAQWASTFAELGLGVSKTMGDLLGTTIFAVMMGSARIVYSIFGKKINLNVYMTMSTCLCVIAYLCILFSPVPVVGLLGCALAGFSVGIFWPGTYAQASESLPQGGTALFALLALAGDAGCSLGPTLSGFVAGAFDGNICYGLGACVVFPAIMAVLLFFIFRMKKKNSSQMIAPLEQK